MEQVLKNNLARVLKLDFAELELRKDGVIELRINPSTLLNAEKGEILKKATNNLGGEQKFPFLIILGEYCTTDETLIAFAKKPENKYSTIEAVVVSSVVQRILGNLYNRVMKPIVPTKIFSNRVDAEYWLKNYK
jgi:hypothetical protein